MRASIGFGLACAALCGCGHAVNLTPARDAVTVPGRPEAAEASARGVDIVVDGNDWSGPDIDGQLTPVKVSIVNRGRHPLRIRYDAFSVTGESGFQLAALPPYQAASAVPPAVYAPQLVYGGFYVAPWEAPFYPGIAPWSGPFTGAPGYMSTYGAAFPDAYRIRAVLDRAIPEGVLEPGGHVTGFIYFQGLGAHGPDVVFRADLVDADTGAMRGRLAIPFVVTHRGKPVAPQARR